MKSERVENIIGELLREKDELYAFVLDKFIETAIRLNIPPPKGSPPKTHLKIQFLLGQKDFIKSLAKIKSYYGSPLEKHPDNFPLSHISARTIIDKKDDEMTAYIFLNCSRIRTEAAKKKIALKELFTLTLIHEICHAWEAQTGIYVLKSSFPLEDGFSVPTYEAWQKSRES